MNHTNFILNFVQSVHNSIAQVGFLNNFRANKIGLKIVSYNNKSFFNRIVPLKIENIRLD